VKHVRIVIPVIVVTGNCCYSTRLVASTKKHNNIHPPPSLASQLVDLITRKDIANSRHASQKRKEKVKEERNYAGSKSHSPQ
jgi:hypothetical protein